MNNKLIKTNSLWYKIKTFFKNIFLKKKTITEKKVPVLHTEQASNNITFEHSLKEKFEHDNQKRVLAEKLLYGELGTSELEETEVDEMTEYFIKDIQNIDNELLKIKQHILTMQQELKQ